MAGQQQEEIETIRSRTIEVKLSDADVKRISEKAAAHGLTVGELIENFIGDLVCGTYSNGSDERMYAEQWFERCWFGMFPDLTFLRYLIEWGGLDEVIGAWENIKSTEENIQTSEEALASGVMKGRGGRNEIESISKTISEQSRTIKSLQEERDKLGIFKGREKKELQNKIDNFERLRRSNLDKLGALGVSEPSKADEAVKEKRSVAAQEQNRAKAAMQNRGAKERAEEVKAAFLEAAKQIPADQRQEILDRMGQQKEIPTMGRLQYYQAEAEARRQLDTALKQEAQTRERNRTHDRDRGI